MVAEKKFDVVVVGAGFGGMYMLHKLLGLGFNATIVEAASGVGGTWWWNRYPGARCDVESLEYSYSFSDDLQQEWEWSQKFSEGPESNNGGLIGPVNVKQTHPVLAKVLLISEKSQLWPPKKIDDWWIILRLEELKNTKLNDEISMMLAFELGDNYLNNESEIINTDFLKSSDNITGKSQ